MNTPVFSAHFSDRMLGTLRLWCTPAGVRRVDFEITPERERAGEELVSGDPPPHLTTAVRQLREYLDGLVIGSLRIRTFVAVRNF